MHFIICVTVLNTGPKTFNNLLKYVKCSNQLVNFRRFCITLLLSYTYILFVLLTGNCHSHHTGNYGSKRIQNTNFEFVWPKLPTGTTQFNIFIRGQNDILFILSPSETGITDDDPGDTGIIKILLGGWQNTDSGVLCNSNANWALYPSPGILNPNEFREFHVSFAGEVLEVSRAGEEPFIRHNIGCSHEINYIGLASGWGSDGDWKYCAS